MWNNWSHHTLLVRMQSHFGKVCQFLIKFKINFQYHSAFSLPGIYLPKRSENLCSHDMLYVSIFRSFILNEKEIERIKMLFDQWNKQTVCQPYSGQVSAPKRNELLICTKSQMNLKWILLSKRQTQKATCYMIPLLWYLERGQTNVFSK